MAGLREFHKMKDLVWNTQHKVDGYIENLAKKCSIEKIDPITSVEWETIRVNK